MSRRHPWIRTALENRREEVAMFFASGTPRRRQFLKNPVVLNAVIHAMRNRNWEKRREEAYNGRRGWIYASENENEHKSGHYVDVWRWRCTALQPNAQKEQWPRLTPPFNHSCIVNGFGTTTGLSASLGTSFGKGNAANISCLADIRSSGFGLASSGTN